MSKQQNSEDKKMNIYLKKRNELDLKQAIEIICFEYWCDKNIFCENVNLDLDYLVMNLSDGTPVFSKKDYSLILKEARKKIKNNGTNT